MVRYRNYEPCMRERGVYYCRLAKQFMRWAIHMQSIKRWVCWNVSQGSHCTRCRSLLSSTHGKCRPFLPPRPLTPSNSSPNPTRLKFKEVSRMPNHLRWPTPQGTVELSHSWPCCNHRIFWRRGFFFLVVHPAFLFLLLFKPPWLLLKKRWIIKQQPAFPFLGSWSLRPKVFQAFFKKTKTK